MPLDYFMFLPLWQRLISFRLTHDFLTLLFCTQCALWAVCTLAQYLKISFLKTRRTIHVCHPTRITTIFNAYVDEMQSGRWKKAHRRPDIPGDLSSRESFSEQQARFAKRSLDVGLIRADFQCLQGNLTHSLLTVRS
jgi:hypothetical protein